MRKIAILMPAYFFFVSTIFLLLLYKHTIAFSRYTLFFYLGFISPCLLIMRTSMGKRVISLWRGFVISYIFHAKYHDLRIEKGFRYRNPKCISIGKGVSIEHDTEFYPVKRYNETEYPSRIIIGNNVHIGAYNRFASKDLVIIEDNVLFAAYVHITDHSHGYEKIDVPIYKQDLIGKGSVIIGKDSWIGLRCSILSGVNIGQHCVIAAGSVVTHDIPDYSIAAGIPARVIKKYDFESERWVRVYE